MKSHHILLLSAALAAGNAWAEDDNSFYFTDAAVLPGETTGIALCMSNSRADLTCLEAEIRLPEGLSLVCDEDGEPVLTLYRNRTAGHELQAGILPDGNLKVLVSDIDGRTISGDDGPILGFRVKAAETAPIGECTLETVGESLLVNSEAEAFYSVGVTGKVLVTDDPTSLNEELRMTNEESEGAPVYNLAGQKLSDGKSSSRKLPRGINIVGGRKELHK